MKMKIGKQFKLNRTDRSWNYGRVGEMARNKIINLVQNENIRFERTYEASKNKNAHFQQKYDYVDDLMKKSITMPKYSDYTAIQRTIIIAHELGHYAVYKSSSPRMLRFLINGGKYVTYLNEYLAWRKARQILKKMKVWKVERVEGEFKNIMTNALSTYKPSERFSVFLARQILNVIYIAVKYWLVSYFMVGLLFLFNKEGIPIPMDFMEIGKGEKVNDMMFYSIVTFIYICSLLIKFFVVRGDHK